ncbi:MAG TPA: acetylglutamate kinase, partial [Alphaproteobacteria bacterium]|nr:acetylglutamate kinase [Alphaproteobacteria bacterium]
VVIVHGGGPQIDDALRDKKIETSKGPDGRRITSPKAMRVVQKVMKEINLQVMDALVEKGIKKEKIVAAARMSKLFVQAEPLDKKDGGLHNRSGKPKAVDSTEINRWLDQGKVVVLHSVAGGKDNKTAFNVNGDDYAMAVAIAIKAKRLILVTNVAGVFDRNRKRIPAVDKQLAEEMIADGTIHGGMVPKVESALWVVKQGVGGVAIIDGFKPWAILAELLTHEGFGTLFQARLG